MPRIKNPNFERCEQCSPDDVPKATLQKVDERKICSESLALLLQVETLLRMSNTVLQEPTSKNGAGEKERREPRERESAKSAKTEKKGADQSFAVVGLA